MFTATVATGQLCPSKSCFRTPLKGGVYLPCAPVTRSNISLNTLRSTAKISHLSSTSTAAHSAHTTPSVQSTAGTAPSAEAVRSAPEAVAQQPTFAYNHGPFASITRMLLVGQPSMMFRSLTNNTRRMPAGPISLLLFVFAVVAAMVASIRHTLARRCKTCNECKGYGVTRCYLCQGSGRVDWRAKFGHFENCPLCMNKRFTVCGGCGGYFNRPIFLHLKRDSKSQSDVFENGVMERV